MKQVICTMILVLTATVANAQSDDVPRYEVGAHFSSVTLTEPGLFSINDDPKMFRTESGVGGRFTYNITDSLAAEAEINFFPKHNDGNGFDDSTLGRATQGLFGVKAGKRFEKFGIFGKARPGFVRFSRAFRTSRVITTEPPLLDIDLGQTNFAADVGGVLEFYPSRRVVVRFDAGDTIIRFSEQSFETICVLPLSDLSACPTSTVRVTRPARTKHNFQINAGVGVRFGAGSRVSQPPSAKRAEVKSGRYELGVLFTSLTIRDFDRFVPEQSLTRTEPGVGGRFTYNLNKSVAAEAEINFFPKDGEGNFNFSAYTAGRTTQGLFGVKAGKRFERFGIFGKVRPGFVRFSRALGRAKRFDSPTLGTFFDFDSDGRTNFATDIGGVLEFYPSRRIVTRFDIGDTIIRYKELRFDVLLPPDGSPSLSPPTTIALPGRTQNNFQFSAGIGVRL